MLDMIKMPGSEQHVSQLQLTVNKIWVRVCGRYRAMGLERERSEKKNLLRLVIALLVRPIEVRTVKPSSA